jgi:nanoRNase/pAp phosphatase (c-di-AMP/oligoRNAs hydrolase)
MADNTININICDKNKLNIDNTKIVIIYHNYCLDGVTGAWVLKKYYIDNNYKLENIELLGQYPQCDNLIDDLKNKQIDFTDNKTYKFVFVDICPNIKNLRDFLNFIEDDDNEHIVEIYDHHESNKSIFIEHKNELETKVSWIFDMNRCGCQIAWDSHFDNSELLNSNTNLNVRPWFIDYVADGDLWKWQLEDGKLIYGILQTNFKSFEKLDFLYEKGDEYFNNEFKSEYLEEARIIHKFKMNRISNYIKKSYPAKFTFTDTNNEKQQYNVVIVECLEYDLVSELGNQLTDIKNDKFNDYPDFVLIIKGYGYDLSKTYNEMETEFWISARSNKKNKPNINLSTITANFGGGGHPQASGFTSTRDKLYNLLYLPLN